MKFGGLAYSLYISVMKTTLSAHDQTVIRDIVSHCHEGDRVHTLRKVFGSDCSFAHFIFLGEVIGLEKAKAFTGQNEYQVFRMKTLSFN